LFDHLVVAYFFGPSCVVLLHSMTTVQLTG